MIVIKRPREWQSETFKWFQAEELYSLFSSGYVKFVYQTVSTEHRWIQIARQSVSYKYQVKTDMITMFADIGERQNG